MLTTALDHWQAGVQAWSSANGVCRVVQGYNISTCLKRKLNAVDDVLGTMASECYYSTLFNVHHSTNPSAREMLSNLRS